jgi:hypothetical protein
MRGKTNVLDAYGLFIKITKARHIRFVYASAKGFLLSRGVQFGFDSSYSTGLSLLAQRALDAMHIARACITCLLFSDIDFISEKPSTPLQCKKQLRSSIEKYLFLEYAAMN